MDQYWEAELWQPTVTETRNCLDPAVPLSLEEVEIHRESLKACTEILHLLPYTPGNWRNRSAVLLKLGFPELAVADSYKAIVLTSYVFDGKEIGRKVWLETGMAIWHREAIKGNTWKTLNSTTGLGLEMLDLLNYERKLAYSQLFFALDHLKAVQDIKNICKEALEHYPGDPVFLHLQQLATSAYERNRSTINEMPLPDQVKFQLREMGTVWVKPYPWASKINARTAESIAVANSALSKCSKLLRIKTSTVAISSSDKISYGMFATKNIHKDDIVLEARPVLSVNGSQLKQHMNLLNPLCGIRKTGSKTLGSCYNCSGSLEGIDQKYGFVCCAHLYFCSKDCKNLAKQYYHDALCGVNISHIYAAMEGEKCYLSGPEIAGLKWLRILAVCKQRGKHPLQHPLVANLTSHEGSAHDPWSLESRVIKPLRTLEMLGVDVFTDQWYDTWVLELLWQRFRVNAVGTGEGSECEAWVDSSHAMFNHSCEDPPMLYCYQDKSSLKYHWCARREIKKGEEVFVSYIGDSLPQSTKERRELLNGWLSGECRCKRCLLG